MFSLKWYGYPIYNTEPPSYPKQLNVIDLTSIGGFIAVGFLFLRIFLPSLGWLALLLWVPYVAVRAYLLYRADKKKKQQKQ
jgi:uncharacterized protein (DUF983 family)